MKYSVTNNGTKKVGIPGAMLAPGASAVCELTNQEVEIFSGSLYSGWLALEEVKPAKKKTTRKKKQ